MTNSTASKAFSNQSVIFDQVYDSNPIVAYMRGIIREMVLKNLQSNDHILEVNAGTASDAIFFAQQGYKVNAYDISPGMVTKSNEKIRKLDLSDKITFNELNYEEIDQVAETFDYVYSNFGGLNCTANLASVVNKLADRLKPGGRGTLVIMPPFALWEKLHLLKGNIKIATRRKLKTSSKAHIEGEHFHCWYYNPDTITKALKGKITHHETTGLCVLSPPSFLDKFPLKYPRLYLALTKIDQKIAKWPVFNSIGDYYIYSFTKL